MSFYIIAFRNTHVGVRENEAAKQVILAVSSTDQKDRERTHTKGSQGF